MVDTSQTSSLIQEGQWRNQCSNFLGRAQPKMTGSTGDKLKVPLSNWIHKSHRIWKWFYRPQDNNLQRIDRGTVYHYKLVTGHQGTRTTRMYHLIIREEVFSPATQLGSPTSILGFSNQQVVKHNEGPAFPQDPEEISNFWKFLHSWEGNWMWEGIDNDHDKKSDMSWRAKGMTHNSLIWVTDGSYNRKKARDLSGVGWIIFCTRTGLRLGGTFWEKSTGANSYPVEMLSLCAFHLLAQAVAEFYKVDKWAAILRCDNKCALELSSHHRCPHKTQCQVRRYTLNHLRYQTVLYWELQIHPHIRPHGSIS